MLAVGLGKRLFVGQVKYGRLVDRTEAIVVLGLGRKKTISGGCLMSVADGSY